MKKIVKLGILLSMSIWLCACSGKSVGAGNAQASVDVDLGQASNVIAYAEVYNMLMNPDGYIGKTVRLKGTYHATYSDERDAYNHNVIVSDVSACCEMAMRIDWDSDENTNPGEFPEDMSEVVVTGVFKTREQNGYLQGYLDIGEMEF